MTYHENGIAWNTKGRDDTTNDTMYREKLVTSGGLKYQPETTKMITRQMRYRKKCLSQQLRRDGWVEFHMKYQVTAYTDTVLCKFP